MTIDETPEVHLLPAGHAAGVLMVKGYFSMLRTIPAVLGFVAFMAAMVMATYVAVARYGFGEDARLIVPENVQSIAVVVTTMVIMALVTIPAIAYAFGVMFGEPDLADED